jgi:4-hydroxy-tetrahydrodipicolinate synthase
MQRVPEEFKVLSGDDAITIPLIAVGGQGVISVVSNEAPRLMTALTRACLEGDWSEAREIHHRLYPLMKANFEETSPGPVKAALAMMGMVREVYRLPLVPVTGETREKLRRVLAALNLLQYAQAN